MKKNLLTLSTVLASFQLMYAQAPQIVKESWTEKPAIHQLDTKYAKESAVILLDKRRVEYIDESKTDLAEYYTFHRLIHIIDDRGIASFNRIYLGFNENSDVVDIKARAILPGGKIIELNKNNIKDLKEEDGNTYKIFAMDGLTKGCEVEFYYTFKRPVSFFGSEVVQGAFPVQNASLQLIMPKRLKFDVKTYNGTEVATDTTTTDDKTISQITFKPSEGAEEEKYAYYRSNLKRVEYKLSYNSAQGQNQRLFTWNELAKRVYGIYTDYSDRDTKNVTELVTSKGWDKLSDETQKIIAVENYVKKSYSFNDNIKDPKGNDLENVLKNKVMGTIGAVRLYGAIFQSLGVKYQYVLTGDRTKMVIDKQFENWDNCDNPLLYFPAEGKYISPSRPDYRYPYVMPVWGETAGIFLKGTSIGNFTTAIAEVKNIPLENYDKSYDNIEARLEFNPALDSLTIDNKLIFGGYASVELRDAFNFTNDDQKRNIIKEMIKRVSGTDHILSSEVLNKEFEDNEKPLIVHSKTKSGEFLEKTGNKILIKIGLAIGPQIEMYQEKPRQESIDIDFGHIEQRKLEFVIPAGYTIHNPDDLKIEQVYKDNGELTMGFVSNYDIKDNLLTVNIREEYRKTFYPLSQFDQFKKIINASSDFNKVVLVLEKK